MTMYCLDADGLDLVHLLALHFFIRFSPVLFLELRFLEFSLWFSMIYMHVCVCVCALQ